MPAIFFLPIFRQLLSLHHEARSDSETQINKRLDVTLVSLALGKELQ